MNLRQMEVFHAIMVTGSVTAAARKLNVTQPSVSTVLKHCEAALQIQLFDRVGGRLQPTAAAHALFADVAAIFGRVDAVARLSQDLVGGRSGSLSIGAAFPISNGLLPRSVANFLTGRPGLRVVLQSLTTPQVIDRVVNREIEIGIGHDPVLSASVETETLSNWSLACVVAQDHPLARRSVVEIGELASHPIITYLPQIIFRSHVDRAFSAAGVAPSVVVQVSIALTGIMLARYGAGVAIVDPELIARLGVEGVVARRIEPSIGARTVLIRACDVPRSKISEDFLRQLRRDIAAETA